MKKLLNEIMHTPLTLRHLLIALVTFCLVNWLLGCTPHVAPIDVSAERVEEVPQRVQDLQWPCDLCGQPAKMCETENWYRCERCSRPKLKPTKLERQWVMR